MTQDYVFDNLSNLSAFFVVSKPRDFQGLTLSTFGAKPSLMATYIQEMLNAVEKEGIVRRNKEYIDRMGLFRPLLARVRREQYHLIETGEQYIVICNPGALKIHC
jgi:hypothetical protein